MAAKNVDISILGRFSNELHAGFKSLLFRLWDFNYIYEFNEYSIIKV